MSFTNILASVADFIPSQFEDFRRNINPEWISEALHATGTATLRRRRLPAEQVVWLVIGMALMRNRSIHDVVSKLDLALPGSSPSVVPSTVYEARVRLGEEPMQWLFETSAEHWALESTRKYRWRGLALYGIDGSTLRVPDSVENSESFGYASGKHGQSGYPQMRIVALMELHSHVLSSVSYGSIRNGEQYYSQHLCDSIPDHSLTIFDKNFLSAKQLITVQQNGVNRNWLVPAKKNSSFKIIQQLGPNDKLVELKVSTHARLQDPNLPEEWRARAITYQRKGFPPRTLFTSLTDEKSYPATEVAELYHQRWELEMGFDELKTEMLDSAQTIRSKSPAAVQQEMWGVFLAYNLIRVEMMRVADEANVTPSRVSFIASLRYICDEWLWCAIASPGAIPKHLRNLRASLKTFILPPRRCSRSYPRAVKNKISKYPSKRRKPSVQAALNA